VTVCDRNPDRLEDALRLGAGATVSAADGLAAELGEAEPWDVVYEMTGAPQPLDWAAAVTRPGGRIVAAGIQKAPVSVDLSRLSLREIDLIGTVAHRCTTELPRALDLLGRRERGWGDIAPRVHSLEEVVERVLPDLAAGRAAAIKALVDPRLESARPFA
jgi:threonine dehydrogenase-like Zn-dependent dehydrogenase